MQVPVNLNDMPIQDEEISDPSTQLSHIQQKSDVIIPNEEDVATFATVINPQGVFFQAFLAATPKHLIMERALSRVHACLLRSQSARYFTPMHTAQTGQIQ